MRIDLTNQQTAFEQSRSSAKATEVENPASFQKALQSFIKPAQTLTFLPALPPQLLHQSLFIELYSKAFEPAQMNLLEDHLEHLLTKQNLKEMMHSEHLEDHLEKLELRYESIEDALIEDLEEMEKLQDASEARFLERLEDKEDKPRVSEGGEAIEDMIDDPDIEREREIEDNPDQQEEDKPREPLIEIKKKGLHELDEFTVEDMSFEEIRDLAQKILSRHDDLPPRVYQLLNRLLERLLDGQRLPLDQHQIQHLKGSEWHLLLGLFPARFFSGLIRPLVIHYGHDPGEILFFHQIFRKLQYQQPLNDEAQNYLQALYQKTLPETSVFENWAQGLPLTHLETEFHRLKYLLESLQQADAFLPGATGKIQELALEYIHHEEICLHLFQISQHYLKGSQPAPEDLTLLAELLYERCYSHQLLHPESVIGMLEKILKAQDLSASEDVLLYQGIPQEILKYFPHDLLSPSLKTLQRLYFQHPEWSLETLRQEANPKTDAV